MELQLLTSLGFGLDLAKCVVSGSKKDLKFVSPKSGCAVSSKSSVGWEKIVSTPGVFRRQEVGNILSIADLENGFKLTEYFIKKDLNQVGIPNRPFFRLRNGFCRQ